MGGELAGLQIMDGVMCLVCCGWWSPCGVVLSVWCRAVRLTRTTLYRQTETHNGTSLPLGSAERSERRGVIGGFLALVGDPRVFVGPTALLCGGFLHFFFFRFCGSTGLWCGWCGGAVCAGESGAC